MSVSNQLSPSASLPNLSQNVSVSLTSLIFICSFYVCFSLFPLFFSLLSLFITKISTLSSCYSILAIFYRFSLSLSHFVIILSLFLSLSCFLFPAAIFLFRPIRHLSLVMLKTRKQTACFT